MIDKQIIQEKIKKILVYSQGNAGDEAIADLVEKWFEKKRDILEAWGGEPILEFGEVNFELSATEKTKAIMELCDRLDTEYEAFDLSSFIRAQHDGFWSNLVIQDYPYHDFVIPRGMKLIKAFKYFEEDLVLLDKYQTMASMVIQKDKIKGTLCLSVHPLDYLSSSENDYNWRSCHALDGEYRTGNLAYMTDSSTIMCYLKGKDNAKLPDFPNDVLWNSKKWRVLFFLSQDWRALFAGRQYPFVADRALEIVQPYIAKSLNTQPSDWSNWHDDKLTHWKFKSNNDDDCLLDDEYIVIRGNLLPLHYGNLIEQREYTYYFNDLLESHYYSPYYCWYKWRGIKDLHWVIGEPTTCIRCGKNPCCDSGSMFCKECELEVGTLEDEDTIGYCNCCNRRIFIEDGMIVSGDLLCPNCYRTETEDCAYCGTRHYRDELRFSHKLNGRLCSYCYLRQERRHDFFTGS